MLLGEGRPRTGGHAARAKSRRSGDGIVVHGCPNEEHLGTGAMPERVHDTSFPVCWSAKTEFPRGGQRGGLSGGLSKKARTV